jgi:hexosaminidase
MFPGTLFSTGGDEINQKCYEDDAETQKILKEKGWTIENALDTFTQKNHAELRKQNKTAVVWEEMLLEHNVTLASNTVVMSVLFPSAPSYRSLTTSY